MGKENQKQVLIVDDEEAIVMLLETVLSIYGYSTISCTKPAEALKMAKMEKPDLVILDIAMPDKDGYEVCSELKGDPETGRIPVIMVTALALTQDKKKGLESGADGFIFKPFDPMVVISEIERLLG